MRTIVLVAWATWDGFHDSHGHDSHSATVCLRKDRRPTGLGRGGALTFCSLRAYDPHRRCLGSHRQGPGERFWDETFFACIRAREALHTGSPPSPLHGSSSCAHARCPARCPRDRSAAGCKPGGCHGFTASYTSGRLPRSDLRAESSGWRRAYPASIRARSLSFADCSLHTAKNANSGIVTLPRATRRDRSWSRFFTLDYIVMPFTMREARRMKRASLTTGGSSGYDTFRTLSHFHGAGGGVYPRPSESQWVMQPSPLCTCRGTKHIGDLLFQLG
jgi:hypothetical protein